MLQNKKISLVTRFMDRGEHLKQSLPSWLLIPQIDEIIIVDWDSRKDNVIEIVNSIQPQDSSYAFNTPVHILRVNNQEFFNRGACLNTGCHFAQGEFIFHVDCDVVLIKNPLTSIILDKYTLFRATDRWSSLCGTTIFNRDLWYQVGGYAEFQKGWGHDDDYFHGKLYPLGVKKEYMDFSCFHHIDHDDIKSCVYHDMKDRWKSRDLNVATSALIRNVSFNTLPVNVISPDGHERVYSFPCQIIDKKEPIDLMNSIYKNKAVPPNTKKVVDKYIEKHNGISDNGAGKSRNMSVFSFPKIGRL